MSQETYLNDMESFAAHLRSSKRILALLGAGLSAASGLPTFRGAGGMWRNRQAVSIATPEAFEADPSLVWHFYNYRRHMALNAKPNPAHYALAELSKKRPDFVTLSQNVDGLCARAGHPSEQLHNLHGSLFDIKCSGYCDYVEQDNRTDPVVPALAIPRERAPEVAATTDGTAATSNLFGALSGGGSTTGKELDIADAKVTLPNIARKDLPLCPKCQTNLLRPGVVWFGEALPPHTLSAIDAWIGARQIDLMLVIGTSAQVWPAAGYVDIAQARGARVAVVNMDDDQGSMNLNRQDWFFRGDAGEIVPKLFHSVIGDLPKEATQS